VVILLDVNSGFTIAWYLSTARSVSVNAITRSVTMVMLLVYMNLQRKLPRAPVGKEALIGTRR